MTQDETKSDDKIVMYNKRIFKKEKSSNASDEDSDIVHSSSVDVLNHDRDS